MKMRLKNYNVDDPRKAVTKEFEITINEPNVDKLYIKGSDSIRLDRYQNYCLVDEITDEAISSEITYNLDAGEKKPLAVITEVKTEVINGHTALICVLHANAKNELGKITLKATYNGKLYTKAIEVVPLW